MEESQNGIFHLASPNLGLAFPAQANMGLPLTLPQNSKEVSLQRLWWREKKGKEKWIVIEGYYVSHIVPSTASFNRSIVYEAEIFAPISLWEIYSCILLVFMP